LEGNAIKYGPGDSDILRGMFSGNIVQLLRGKGAGGKLQDIIMQGGKKGNRHPEVRKRNEVAD